MLAISNRSVSLSVSLSASLSASARCLFALLLAGAAACEPPDSELEPLEVGRYESGLTQVTGFGSNPGNLLMYSHVPAGVAANAPLVVVMHGCTMTAAAMESSGWTAAANVNKFYVVYPQQQSGNNGSSCFNWFQSEDWTRGSGEAGSVKQMIDYMRATYSIDPARIYVVGFSAGGYMVSVMLAAYPDVFAAGAIDAGGPYRCATSSSDAFSCMSGSVDKTPTAWGDLVRSAYSYTGPRPRVTIWHGASDTTVKPVNQNEAMEQWTNVLGIDQTADTSDTVAGFPHKVYRDGAGNALVETYSITGMSHAVAIDPQTTFPGSTTGCGATGSYLSDVNLCSALLQWQFFTGGGGGGGGGDTTPPTVNITAPANGATVAGTVTVSASASDDVGVARVELYIDGALAASDTAAPYDFSWDTTTAANGAHALLARAYDAAGNVGSDNDTSVTVSNSGVPTTVSFGSIAAEDGYVKALADGSSAAVGTLTTPAVGRGTDGKLNRSIFSFDTSSIPDGATIQRAYLTVAYSSSSGDPWADPAGNVLAVDVKSGTFGAAGIELGDWAAAPDASAVATIAKFTTGSKASSDFGAAGLAAVNKLGRTQLKLRFTQNQLATNYLFLKEGASATLTVVYLTP